MLKNYKTTLQRRFVKINSKKKKIHSVITAYAVYIFKKKKFKNFKE